MAKYEHSSYVPAYHPPEDRWDEYIDLATRWFLKVQDEIDTIFNESGYAQKNPILFAAYMQFITSHIQQEVNTMNTQDLDTAIHKLEDRLDHIKSSLIHR